MGDVGKMMSEWLVANAAAVLRERERERKAESAEIEQRDALPIGEVP